MCSSLTAGFEQGHRLYEAGKYAEAIPELLEFVQKAKPDENWPQAHKELSDAYKRLGNQYYQQKDFPMAVALYYSANTDKADQLILETRYSWALALREREESDSAIQQITKVLSAHPSSALRDKSLLLRMEIELYDLEDEDATLNTYQEISSSAGYSIKQKALTMIKGLANNYVKKADDFYNSGKYDEALTIYYQVIDWVPSLESSLESKILEARKASLVSRGDKAARANDWESAEELYYSALKMDPYNSSLSGKLRNAIRNRIAQEHPGWSSKWINMIMSQKIAVGMERSMLLESWGSPDATYDNYDGTYTWVYYSDPLLGKRVKITFANDKISKIQ
jgi:predicted Zn-dependent protease